MFNKLVANLNFNPGLINQIGFYANRLRKENTLRRLSFLFIALAMVIQTFAVVSPPQKSLAASSNHIFDGLTTKNSVRKNVNLILGAWDNTDIKDIYGYFGVTKKDIADIAKTQSKHTKLRSCRTKTKNWWSTGRNSLSGYSKVKDTYKNSQVAVEYSPNKYIYQRELKAWNVKNSCNDYYALQGKISATGKTFYILLDCGNFTTLGRYVPPKPPKPEPVIGASCSVAGPITLKRGSNIATIPVTVYLAKGTKIPKGSPGHKGKGLHIGVTSVNANRNWNIDDINTLKKTNPVIQPDDQQNYIPQAKGNSGASYYQANINGKNFKRYYVNSSHSKKFTVNLKVFVKNSKNKIAIRLIDRGRHQWIQHSSSCEALIKRETPEKCKYNDKLEKGDPRCKPCKIDGKENLWAEDPNCKEPVPDPILEIRKTIVSKKTSYKPGDTLTYLIEYRNTVNGSAARNVVIKDNLDSASVEVIGVKPALANKGLGNIELNISKLGYSRDFQAITVQVKLASGLKSQDKYCNISSINASNAPEESSKACFSVIVPCKYDPSLPDENDPNCLKPVVACSVTESIFDPKTKKTTFLTTAESSNKKNTTILGYDYDFGDSNKQSNSTDKFEDRIEHTYPVGKYNMTATVRYRTTGQESQQDQRASCEKEVFFDTPVSKEKEVVNLTNKSAKKVHSGDELMYTLITHNSLNVARNNVVVKDYIGDILDYADLDIKQLEKSGGKFDSKTKTVIWKKVKIPAGSNVKHTFKVKAKKIIPATNTPSTLGTAYDCEISNEYGNEVSLKVACPVVKKVESLPNTGPGTSLIGGMGITLVVGYFYSRSRLLKKELEIVKNDFVATGGA